MGKGANQAAAGLQSGAAVAGTVAAIGTAAAAVNAVPIAGQVVGAVLGLTAIMVKMFGGKRKEKRESAQQQAEQFMRQRAQNMQGPTQRAQGGNEQQQQAPATQGMGQFQQMQAGDGPIYATGGNVPQPGVTNG